MDATGTGGGGGGEEEEEGGGKSAQPLAPPQQESGAEAQSLFIMEPFLGNLLGPSTLRTPPPSPHAVAPRQVEGNGEEEEPLIIRRRQPPAAHSPAAPGATRVQGGSLIFKQAPTLIAQSLANRLGGAVNTKGFLLMVVLFMMRYRTFSNVTKKLALIAGIGAALIANFNLDLDSKARRKGLTVGISRMFTLGLCFLILKRYRWSGAFFYCGLVARVVPVSMYYFFRGIYEITHGLLYRFEDQQLLPSPDESSPGRVPDPSMQCCICLDAGCDYRTSCNHYFHRTCLEQWVEIKLNCPLCTQRIQSNYLWARNLHKYFVLNYNEWRQMHHFLCGDWYT